MEVPQKARGKPVRVRSPPQEEETDRGDRENQDQGGGG